MGLPGAPPSVPVRHQLEPGNAFHSAFHSQACPGLDSKMVVTLSSGHIRAAFSFSQEVALHVCQLASVVSDSATPWTVASQAALSMGFSRQDYWSGCHALLQGIFPTQELNPCLLQCPALARGFFSSSATWEAPPAYQGKLNRKEATCKQGLGG